MHRLWFTFGLLSLLFFSGLLLLPAPAAHAGYGTCSGFRTTIDGTDGDDIIYGTDGDDVIYTGPGNDVVYAGAGNDIICTWTGNDVVYGGDGDDRIYGDGGDDRLYGEAGNDTLVGVADHDLLEGGPGNDTLYGNSGNDTLRGGDGDDRLYAMTGDDTLDGGAGRDTCNASFFTEPADVVTGCESITALLFASADTFVRDGAYAMTAYGSAPTLDVKTSLTPGYTRIGLVRFALPMTISGTLQSAQLLLTPVAMGQAQVGQQAQAIDAAWSEQTPWTMRPVPGAVVARWTAQRGTQSRVDLITVAQRAWQGQTSVNLAITGTRADDDDWLRYASNADANKARRPLLRVWIVAP